jgi:hypothetical protein
LAQSRVPSPAGRAGHQQGESRERPMIVLGQPVRYEDPFAMPFDLNPCGSKKKSKLAVVRFFDRISITCGTAANEAEY